MLELSFHSFTGLRPKETHTHAQFLLAMEGGMEIEVGGVTTKLDTARCAFVPTGVIHTQLAKEKNSFIRVNCGEMALGLPLSQYLGDRFFLPVSEAARQLISFAEKAQHEQMSLDLMVDHWMRLLLASLSGNPQFLPDSRLARLTAYVERTLDFPWTVREMSNKAGMSPSRLHALFQECLHTTPQDWLAAQRIKKVQQWLAQTDLSIAELAQRAGYSDQSALTRTMRRLTGQTPAAFRREQWELRASAKKPEVAGED